MNNAIISRRMKSLLFLEECVRVLKTNTTETMQHINIAPLFMDNKTRATNTNSPTYCINLLLSNTKSMGIIDKTR